MKLTKLFKKLSSSPSESVVGIRDEVCTLIGWANVVVFEVVDVVARVVDFVV